MFQSNCEWVNGDGNPYSKSAFDFRAVSDYTPLRLDLVFDPAATNDDQDVQIIVTDDTVRVADL